MTDAIQRRIRIEVVRIDGDPEEPDNRSETQMRFRSEETNSTYRIIVLSQAELDVLGESPRILSYPVEEARLDAQDCFLLSIAKSHAIELFNEKNGLQQPDS